MIPPKTSRLLRLEIRRATTPTLRSYGLLVVGLAVFVAIGKATSEAVVFFLMVATAVPAGAVVGATLRDKLEGTMEFVASLPVRGATVAGARFMANFLFILPMAAVAGVLMGRTAAPSLGLEDRLEWGLGAALSVWLVGGSLACLATGAVAKYSPQRVATFATVMIFATLVADEVLSTPEDWARWALEAGPGRLVALATGAVLVVAGVALGVGFLLVRSAFDNFDPKLDAMER